MFPIIEYRRWKLNVADIGGRKTRHRTRQRHRWFCRAITFIHTSVTGSARSKHQANGSSILQQPALGGKGGRGGGREEERGGKEGAGIGGGGSLPRVAKLPSSLNKKPAYAALTYR